MLSKKSAGDLEACSALVRQVLKCFLSYSEELLLSTRPQRPLTFLHLPQRAVLLCAVQLNAFTEAIKSFQLITHQDYGAGLGSSCSFQQKKNALDESFQEFVKGCDGTMVSAFVWR